MADTDLTDAHGTRAMLPEKPMSEGDHDSKPDPKAPPAASRVDREIDDLFDDFDQLLKNPEVGAVLTDRGVNVSLAIIAADGLRALLKGEKERAVEDLSTAAEEIQGRLLLSRLRSGAN